MPVYELARWIAHKQLEHEANDRAVRKQQRKKGLTKGGRVGRR